MSAELLRDLARAKVAFQIRAIEAIIRDEPNAYGRTEQDCRDDIDRILEEREDG